MTDFSILDSLLKFNLMRFDAIFVIRYQYTPSEYHPWLRAEHK